MLFLRTLGGLSLEVAGRAVVGAGGQRRPLAILAVIAASGERGISRERIQSLFWPDGNAERASGVLKQALYALRRDLKAQELTLGTTELRLNPEVITSDLRQFLETLSQGLLEEAVALYAGPFLEGIQFRDLDEFERWSSRERDLLAKKHQSALESLARKHAAANDHQTAAKWWASLAAVDPYSSRIAAEYMRALAASGQRETAIKHGDLLSRLLRQDLGAEPDTEVLSLVAQLKKAPENASRTRVSEPAIRLEEVKPEPSAAADRVREGPIAASAVNVQKPTTHGLSPGSSRPLLPLVVAGCFALAVTATVAVGLARGRADRTTRAADANRVVVIPFENRTGDPSLDALGPLGADWITDGLARTGLIPVADPATAAAAVRRIRERTSGKGDPLGEIAEVTGARSLVNGSFYRRGDSLEFHARISDGKTGRVLGSIEPVAVPVAGASNGIELLRQKVLSLLAHLFDARLSQVVMPDVSPPAFEAYKEFVAGVDLWAKDVSIAESDGVGSGEAARGYFRRAYALDTTFATALVWALFTYTDDRKEAKPLLDSLELRRDRLTPLDRYAIDYFLAGMKSDVPATIAAAEAASDLAPRSEWSWNAGQALFPLNRPREVLKYFGRLDPNHGWMRQGWEYYWYMAAQMKHMVGDLAGTRQWLEQARRKFPQNVPIAAAYARALALTGQPDSVAPIVREILQSGVDWRAFYVYSILADLQRHGRYADARAIYQQFVPWYTAKGTTATEPDRREFGTILFAMNMGKDATAQFRSMLADFPTSTWRTRYTGHLAVLAAMRGDTASAVRLINSVPKKIEQWPGENSYWRARVAAQLGHKTEAVSLLQTAFAERYPQISLSHSTWYDFPTLQGYPPFEALVASDR